MARRLFWIVVALAIISGILFRFLHVEHRMLWADESWTALRISGHYYGDLARLFDGRRHPVAQLLELQRPTAATPMSATVIGLAREEPQHPPLFYLIDRAWTLWFGSSIADLRVPALLFGLIAMLAVSWLCFELTGSAIIAGVGAALMAVSPFFVNYSAQAREYTLWAGCICVCSALLLRALRRSSALRWAAYGAAMALALYADVLMLAVLAGHVAYVLAARYRDRRTLCGFGLAAGAATRLFLPWLLVCIRAHAAISGDESWTNGVYPLRLFVEKWCFNIGSVLFDAEYGNMRLLVIAVAMSLLVAYAVVRLFRDERPALSWFVAAPRSPSRFPRCSSIYSLGRTPRPSHAILSRSGSHCSSP